MISIPILHIMLFNYWLKKENYNENLFKFLLNFFVKEAKWNMIYYGYLWNRSVFFEFWEKIIFLLEVFITFLIAILSLGSFHNSTKNFEINFYYNFTSFLIVWYAIYKIKFYYLPIEAKNLTIFWFVYMPFTISHLAIISLFEIKLRFIVCRLRIFFYSF